jgi:transcriptional regulator with XRE-family HTH domain
MARSVHSAKAKGAKRSPGPTAFGRSLKAARAERGLTLRELSEKSGISITYLSDLERGTLENPTLKALTAISGAMGLSPNDLLGVDGQESPSARPELPATLAEFAGWPQFREAIENEAKKRRVDQKELERDWLEALRAVSVRGRRPRQAADYMFIFEAMRRAIGG